MNLLSPLLSPDNMCGYVLLCLQEIVFTSPPLLQFFHILSGVQPPGSIQRKAGVASAPAAILCWNSLFHVSHLVGHAPCCAFLFLHYSLQLKSSWISDELHWAHGGIEHRVNKPCSDLHSLSWIPVINILTKKNTVQGKRNIFIKCVCSYETIFFFQLTAYSEATVIMTRQIFPCANAKSL